MVAVDIPSGLPADGEASPGPVVKADYTVTFTAPKTGMFAGKAGERIGRLIVSDIGSSRALIDEVGKGKFTGVSRGVRGFRATPQAGQQQGFITATH